MGPATSALQTSAHVQSCFPPCAEPESGTEVDLPHRDSSAEDSLGSEKLSLNFDEAGFLRWCTRLQPFG